MAARACTLGRCFGRRAMFMRRNPTPMAPEDTITTRWPAACRLHAVSTMRERIERRGWCVFSSTMEDVPGRVGQSLRYCHRESMYYIVFTKFDDDGELTGLLSHMDSHCGSIFYNADRTRPWVKLQSSMAQEDGRIFYITQAMDDCIKPNIPSSKRRRPCGDLQNRGHPARSDWPRRNLTRIST
jgi:hypothetical protein